MKPFSIAVVGAVIALQSAIAEARSFMEQLDQKLFGHKNDLNSAYEAYDAGKFDEASKALQAAADHSQGSPQLSYNAGVAAYKAGKAEDAVKYFQKAAAGSDRDLKAKALFNTGVIHIDKNDLESARNVLKEALAFDNENKAIQDNLEWVEQQLKEHPPQPKDKDQKKSADDPQNQAQNDKQKQEKDQGQQKDGQEQDPKKAKDQQDASKSGEPKDQKNAQDQMSAEEKQKQEKDKEGGNAKSHDKDGKEPSGSPADKDKGLAKQGQDKGQNDQTAAKDDKSNAYDQAQKDKDPNKPKDQDAAKAMQKGNDKDKDPGQEDKTATPGQVQTNGRSQTVLTPAELKQQEAERLLRSIDDKIGLYPLTDTEATGTRGKDGKNW